MGLLNVMTSNARLKRGLDKAKNVQAGRDFTGPDGDYLAKFNRVATGTKDNIPYAIFEFFVDDVEGQEDFSGEKLPIIYIRFADQEYSTAEENMSQFFELLQKLGINTPELSTEQIEKQLEQLQKDKPACKVSVVTKGKYKNLYLRGVAVEGSTTYEYAPEAEDDQEPDLDAQDASDDASEPQDGDDSEWVGMVVGYKPPRALKPKQCTITAVDTEAETVDLLADDGKEYTSIPFDKVITD